MEIVGEINPDQTFKLYLLKIHMFFHLSLGLPVVFSFHNFRQNAVYIFLLPIYLLVLPVSSFLIPIFWQYLFRSTE